MKKALKKERENLILKLIVENYIKSGVPISSKLIAEKLNYKISSATIRNIMAKLDEEGFLYQPHTSAGRIPTDLGLKFYINKLLEEISSFKKEYNFVSKDFFEKEVDLDLLLEKTSKFLSDFSDSLGIVLYPRISRINFKRLKFIKLSENRIMLIMTTTSNFTITDTIYIRVNFTQNELDLASEYLNKNFAGKNLIYVRDYFLKTLPKERALLDKLIKKLINFLKNYFNFEKNRDKVFLEGQANLLAKPELFKMDELKMLFEDLEKKAKLIKLLTNFINAEGVRVIIGSEIDLPFFSGCTLIISNYRFKNQSLGSLGILGPKRMPYKEVINLVDYTAKSLTRAISKAHWEV
ncbi:heat-inducible transcriptional repressor HrcA [SCandidatus Aminicenantes bacterium Aminicenantia_JdfR_composite]|jgi:heat-inducible transcriptional repressor|nr:heat-inducible transcriptional repressor HrcA [SCandidatus Aminicenantes bacterium Aminicenantia_JdfR_composite]MCP2598021.1 heat-inducible transcriptional repressor HrcA [Candidatus Aminicenantes bacterium AC-335-L06]